MASIDTVISFIRRYARGQQRIDSAALLLFTLGMVVICLLVSLLLFKSPFYGLLGLYPLLFLKKTPLVDRARTLEQHFGLHGELVNSIQLHDLPVDSKERYSRELINAYIDRTSRVCETTDPSYAITNLPLQRALRIFYIALILFLLYPVLTPARFWYSVFQRIDYHILPTAQSYTRGDKISLGIRFFGVYMPSKTKIEIHEPNSSARTTIPVQNEEASLPIAVDNAFSYRFTFFNQTTPIQSVDVVDPLSIRSLSFDLTYPSYTRLANETKTGRHILAPQGTQVVIHGIASAELNAAFLYTPDTVSLTCNDHIFTGEFTVISSTTMILHLCGRSHLDENITVYAIPDMPPLVDVFYPGQDVVIPQSMNLLIGVQCSDDYGINQARFVSTLKETVSTNLPAHHNVLEDTFTYIWDLTTLHILPGDEVTYHVVVTDNAGNSTRSPSYRVFFPTMEEIYQEVTNTQENITEDLQTAQIEHTKDIEALTRLQETIMKERTLSWADQEQLNKLLSNEKQLLERIDQWHAELERTIEQLEQGIVLDQQSIERLQEISRILQEIAPDELKQALEQLQRMANQNPQRMQETMELLKQHKEEIAKALERTLEILHRYQQELTLQELAEMAADLAQQAGEIDSLGNEQSKADLEAKTDQLLKDMEKFAQMLEDLAQSEGLEPDLSEALTQYANQTRSMLSQMPGRLDVHKQNFDLMSAELAQWYERLTTGRAARLRKKLMEMLDQLIEISKTEEDLDQGDKSIDIDKQYQILSATRTVAESLYAQKSKTMYITSHMAKNMAKVLVNMEQAVHAKPGLHQQYVSEAMRLVNLVALEMLENIEEATRGDGSSTGLDQFLQQLANISQGQMTLNQSLFNMFPIPQPGLSSQQQAQLSKLAATQKALREALEGLQQKYSGTEYQSVMDKIVEDMQKTEEALYQYKLDRELIERQQKILTRLLDAQKSIRTEDYGKKRKSTPGSDITRQNSPGPLSGDLGKDELRLMLQRALRNPLPEHYELYIREYFKRLIEE